MPYRATQQHDRRQQRAPADTRRITFDCEADILDGLERYAAAELSEQFGSAVRLVAAQRPDALRFTYAGHLRDLLALRSVIAVYLVQRFAVSRPRALLGHQHFEALIAQIELARGLFPADAYRTLRLSAAGAESSVLTRLKDELARRTGLTVAPDEGDLLLRLRRAATDDGWEMLVRLAPRPLATRAWRVCNLPGAMNATLAYAMARLSAPSPDDRVLNLACGSGTLLIERLACGPARSAIGCDTDSVALMCAQQNIVAAGCAQLAQLAPWDITRLPLPDSSINMLCADLPFGQIVGSHRANEELYPQALAEAARVAMPGARMVLLTHEVRLIEQVIQTYADRWQVEEVVRVRTGGMNPRMYLLRRVIPNSIDCL